MRILIVLLIICVGGLIYNKYTLRHGNSFFAAAASSHQAVNPNAKVDMYSLTTCGICKAMAREMNKSGIQFNEYKIDTDSALRAELIGRLQKANIPISKVNVAPILFVGNNVFWGFTPMDKIQSAIQ